MKKWIAAALLVTLSGSYAQDNVILPKTEENRLIDLETVLTLEGVSNLDGGIDQRTRTLGNLDITLEMATENAGLWDGGTLFVYFLGNHGSDPTEFVGDVQGTSNIEAYDTFKLYEVWYQQQLGDFSLLTGLHDYNSEFAALDSAGIFFCSSFGITPDISQAGPSIFPTTSLAVRADWKHSEGYFVRAAAYDGVPGDPENPKGTQIIIKKDDGLFYALEAGCETETFKVALGSWYLNTDHADFSGDMQSHNGGVYIIGETAVGETYSVFMQLGKALSDRNEIGSYVGGGVHADGLLSEADEAGFGIAHARASSENRRVNSLGRAETAFELTYAYTFTDNLNVQPSLQYVVDPSMDPTVDNATVFALRVTLTY